MSMYVYTWMMGGREHGILERFLVDDRFQCQKRRDFWKTNKCLLFEEGEEHYEIFSLRKQRTMVKTWKPH